MKMIDIDALIEYCTNENAMLHAHNQSVACAALRRVVVFAKEYAVDTAKWVSPDEKQPNDGEDVLVWFEYYRYGEYNCLYQTHGIGTYFENFKSWLINGETGWRDLRVIAWMPLPEKPESEDDAE